MTIRGWEFRWLLAFAVFVGQAVHVTSAFSGEAAWQSEWEKVI